MEEEDDESNEDEDDDFSDENTCSMCLSDNCSILLGLDVGCCHQHWSHSQFCNVCIDRHHHTCVVCGNDLMCGTDKCMRCMGMNANQ